MGPDRVVVSMEWPSVAAGTAEERFSVVPCPGEWKLDAVYFVPATAVTASDTNYLTISVKQGTTKLVTDRKTDVAGGGFTKGTAVELAIDNAAGKSLEFSQGDVIEVDKAETGTGAVLDGAFHFHLVKLRV